MCISFFSIVPSDTIDLGVSFTGICILMFLLMMVNNFNLLFQVLGRLTFIKTIWIYKVCIYVMCQFRYIESYEES